MSTVHRGETNNWPMISCPKDVSNDSFVCYQDISDYLVSKISNEGFMVNQHSKNITKPKFLLQLHLALQHDNLSESTFEEKYSFAHYLKIGT